MSSLKHRLDLFSLERGRFHWPETSEVRSVSMRPEELAMLIKRTGSEESRFAVELVSSRARGIKHFQSILCIDK